MLGYWQLQIIKNPFFCQKKYQRKNSNPQDAENNLVNWNWKDAPHQVISSWVKTFGRSRGTVAVVMAHTLVSPFGTLNDDTGPFVFVCLFLLWYEYQSRWKVSIPLGARSSSVVSCNPKRTVCTQAGIVYVKSLKRTIVRLWVIGVKILTKPFIWTWYQQ